jgi:hypothetical protein
MCKQLLSLSINRIIKQHSSYINDIIYIRDKIIQHRAEDYLILDGPCMSLTESINFLDPECKYKCFLFTDNKKEILLRSRFYKSTSCLKFLEIEYLKIVMDDPEDLISVDSDLNEVKVKSIDSAIDIIKLSSTDINDTDKDRLISRLKDNVNCSNKLLSNKCDIVLNRNTNLITAIDVQTNSVKEFLTDKPINLDCFVSKFEVVSSDIKTSDVKDGNPGMVPRPIYSNRSAIGGFLLTMTLGIGTYFACRNTNKLCNKN